MNRKDRWGRRRASKESIHMLNNKYKTRAKQINIDMVSKCLHLKLLQVIFLAAPSPPFNWGTLKQSYFLFVMGKVLPPAWRTSHFWAWNKLGHCRALERGHWGTMWLCAGCLCVDGATTDPGKKRASREMSFVFCFGFFGFSVLGLAVTVGRRPCEDERMKRVRESEQKVPMLAVLGLLNRWIIADCSI